jgi:dihydroorotate dehydrogenase
MLYKLAKKILFNSDAESIHDLTINAMALSPKIFKSIYQRTDQSILSTNDFINPIGLAAGLDKNAKAVEALSYLGFGFIEIGTITYYPQMGNHKPRIFRYPHENSLRNSMGFPNEGFHDILLRIKNNYQLRNRNYSLGVNIGKNKETSDNEAVIHQANMAREFSPFCDYLVINISSPNTAGLREWQNYEKLNSLLSAINLATMGNNQKPLYVKISPDLSMEELESIIAVAKANGVYGIIATNTTIAPERGIGGMSGEYLYKKSQLIRNALLEKTKDSSLKIIGVGGFSTAEQIIQFLINGGAAVQIYTSLIYHGPAIVEKLKLDLTKIIHNDNESNLQDYLNKRRAR